MKNFMKKNLFKIILSVFVFLVVVSPMGVFAQDAGFGCLLIGIAIMVILAYLVTAGAG
jgi:hypothetical protein